MKRVFLALALVPLTGCIWDPVNRTNQQSTASIAIDGYAPNPNSTITISAKNLNTGVVTTIGTAVSSSTPTFTTPYNMYYWSVTLTPASNYWSPQLVSVGGVNLVPNGLPASAGRLEFTATAGSSPFATFSAAARQCALNEIAAGANAYQAGSDCTDGNSIVTFDNDGVGNGAPATGWVTDYVGPTPPPGVAWEIGHYQVQSKNIYGLICRPTSAGAHKAAIINHGGYGPLDDFALNAFCIAGAQSGWVTAMSAYRGEAVTITGAPAYTSQGNIELCQGEVTDVLRLTDLVRARADVDNTRVLMWGHSHGACITERAVQRGALVKAAAAFAAPTDMAAWYGYIDPVTQGQLATTFGVYGGPSITPAQSAIPYDWRSPVKYKEDLAARKDVKFLWLQGGADLMIHPSQACSLASGSGSTNWHFNPNGSVNNTSPADCASYPLTWQSGGLPYWSWPAMRYLLVYDYADHNTIVGGQAWTDFINWVSTIFP